MEHYRVQASNSPPMPFPPVPTGPLKSAEVASSPTMDWDISMSENDRTQRAASVLSGMSAEDMEAAETLNSLHASMSLPHTSFAPHV